jgi:hypothetical protein
MCTAAACAFCPATPPPAAAAAAAAGAPAVTVLLLLPPLPPTHVHTSGSVTSVSSCRTVSTSLARTAATSCPRCAAALKAAGHSAPGSSICWATGGNAPSSAAAAAHWPRFTSTVRATLSSQATCSDGPCKHSTSSVHRHRTYQML